MDEPQTTSPTLRLELSAIRIRSTFMRFNELIKTSERYELYEHRRTLSSSPVFCKKMRM